ncbi:hypothetical protein F2Q70_00043763 [Brassica cretica]|uniref:Uncharacterized protein n=1 Tax=Brassica cretica TaxID=69181 RepID=A0A8S9KID4_BRACR|nr:hypothetical protein F2Q70_00043763 [Brassica cretica]
MSRITPKAIRGAQLTVAVLYDQSECHTRERVLAVSKPYSSDGDSDRGGTSVSSIRSRKRELQGWDEGMLVDPTRRTGDLDCSFGPTFRTSELDGAFSPTRPFGELGGAFGPTYPFGELDDGCFVVRDPFVEGLSCESFLKLIRNSI